MVIIPKTFCKYIFIIYLRLFGVTFYKTDQELETKAFKQVAFSKDTKEIVTFYFHKQEYTDIVFRFGRISKRNFYGYIIQCHMSDIIDDPRVMKYNKMKIFLNSTQMKFLDEETLIRIMMDFYIDYIRHELGEEEKRVIRDSENSL